MKKKVQDPYSLPFSDFMKNEFIRGGSKVGEDKTIIVYRGGKISISNWVIENFPPHRIFVDVFGGGAAISLAKSPSDVDVYNDVGNVALFMQVLKDYGDGLYRALYFTPWSREIFEECHKEKDKLLDVALINDNEYNEVNWVSWARAWYVSMLQSFRHEEDDPSWLVSKGVNTAESFANHVDDLPKVVDRLRKVIIEHKDFADIIKVYDGPDVLFYLDPPYVPGTWEGEGYRNEMPFSRHEEMLDYLVTKLKGQAVVSGYPSELYDNKLSGWKRITKTRKGMMRNSKQSATDRTEVLWIKEHHAGFDFYREGASYKEAQTTVARVQEQNMLA